MTLNKHYFSHLIKDLPFTDSGSVLSVLDIPATITDKHSGDVDSCLLMMNVIEN